MVEIGNQLGAEGEGITSGVAGGCCALEETSRKSGLRREEACMSDSAGLGKEYPGIGVLEKPCQWPHVRSRRRFAATRPPLLSKISMTPMRLPRRPRRRPLNRLWLEQEVSSRSQLRERCWR